MGGTASPAAHDEAATSCLLSADVQSSADAGTVLATLEMPAARAPNSNVAPPPVTFRRVPFKNPVVDDRVNTGIVPVGQTSHAFAADRGDGNVPAASSPDMVNWSQSPSDALSTLPAWAISRLRKCKPSMPIDL